MKVKISIVPNQIDEGSELFWKVYKRVIDIYLGLSNLPCGARCYSGDFWFVWITLKTLRPYNIFIIPSSDVPLISDSPVNA